MVYLESVSSRDRVYLNGIGLSDIDSCIRVHDVVYTAPDISTQTVDRGRYNGSRVMRQRTSTSEIQVVFDIHEYDHIVRQEIMNSVVAWAMTGGVLTCDDRPNQRLRVVCTSPPSITSMQRWTSRLSVTFTAFSIPFWEDIRETSTVLPVGTTSGLLYGVGSAADSFVSVKVRASTAMTTLRLNVGDTFFSFSGISICAGETLMIGYDNDILYIKNTDTNVSYLASRTAASSDDLIAKRGQFNTISYVSNGSGLITFSTRGLYL